MQEILKEVIEGRVYEKIYSELLASGLFRQKEEQRKMSVFLTSLQNVAKGKKADSATVLQPTPGETPAPEEETTEEPSTEPEPEAQDPIQRAIKAQSRRWALTLQDRIKWTGAKRGEVGSLAKLHVLMRNKDIILKEDEELFKSINKKLDFEDVEKYLTSRDIKNIKNLLSRADNKEKYISYLGLTKQQRRKPRKRTVKTAQQEKLMKVLSPMIKDQLRGK